MGKGCGRVLAAVACSLSTAVATFTIPAAGQSPDVDPQTSDAAEPVVTRSGGHLELEAPIVVDLDHDEGAAGLTAPDSADGLQIAKVKRDVRELRDTNRQLRADELEQSATIYASGNLVVPRASQTQNGLYVTYANTVPAAAKIAIESAVNKWTAAIDTTTGPVEIEVTWSRLGSGVLGSAGPETYISHSSLPTSLWYPAAQANVLGQADFNGAARPEIQVELNSGVNWYMNTTGQPATNQIDLVSVVLHEIGHGLGFLGSARVTGGVLGLISPPFIYDRHVTHGGSLLTNISDQDSALTSNNLYIKSSASATAELYAPSTWLQGTSYSHFRATGSQSSALMTPSLQFGTAKRTIDALTLGVLEQTGWTLLDNNTPNSGGGTNDECSISSPNPTFASAVSADATGAQVWRLYSAFYLRQPASGGYDYWRNARDNGWPHTKISNYFASSTEFVNRYGTLNNGQFVDLVFSNVLCREPSADGRNYWIGRLQNGMTRGDLMLFFSEGQEYLNKTGTAHPLVG